MLVFLTSAPHGSALGQSVSSCRGRATLLAGRKLLVADDSVAIQKIVSLTFADEGAKVMVASDGEQAIEILKWEVPDLVLADVHMPRRSGYEVCAYIKSRKSLQHIPVLLLVNVFEPFNEAEARKVGADGVLTKPFQSIRELVNKVGTLLGGKSGGGVAEERVTEAAETTPPAAADSPKVPSPSEAKGAAGVGTSVDQQVGSGAKTTPLVSAEAPADLSASEDIIEMSEAEDMAQEADDLILDLGEEEVRQEAALAEEEAFVLDLDDLETADAGPKVGAVSEEGEAEIVVEVSPEESEGSAVTIAATEPLEAQITPAVLEDQAEPNTPISTPRAESSASQLRIDHLSPEVIDAIARRVVEQMSERVVQEIAWEVVPQLAELLIKRQLEEERARRQ
jgi:CheY-like chemotaxis protein